MKRKRKAFVKVLENVKLVLVNIRFRLDISMPVMVTNPGIGFGPDIGLQQTSIDISCRVLKSSTSSLVSWADLHSFST